MGNCKTREVSEQLRVHKEIERRLKIDKEAERDVIKLLLLGTAECGKSTILKQINILHNSGYSKSYLESYKSVVFCNILNGMANILRAREIFMLRCDSDEIETLAHHILSVIKGGQEYSSFSPETYNALRNLWKDPVIQKTYNMRNMYELGDGFGYFMTHLDRIKQPDYIPTSDDILRIRVPTTGVVQTVINIKGTVFRIFDVGGQRSERRKWIHIFEDVRATIYISAISEFDQQLVEDPDTNRLKESMYLFAQVCNNKYFINSSMILFLNKRDLFEQKIKSKSLNVVYSSYEGTNDCQECISYIQYRFESMNKQEGKIIYTHITCATDTNQMELVFDSVIHMIIGRNLMGACIE